MIPELATSDGWKISPRTLRLYLKRRDWEEIGQYDDAASIWEQPRGSEQIWVPTDEDMMDYGVRLTEAVEVLSSFHEEREEKVVQDLIFLGSDKIQVRVGGGQTAEGSIPLEAGVDLLSGSERLVKFCAQAAIEPRRYYGGPMKGEVARVMEELRLGQTERGSFVLVLFLPPRSGSEESSLDGPFGRRVTRATAGALQALVSLIPSDRRELDWSSLESSVEEGVSSNLCETLADLTEAVPADTVQFNISTSPTVPELSSFPSHFEFHSRQVNPLREASDYLRQEIVTEDEVISGPVVSLSRENPGDRGEVKIRTPILGSEKKVKLSVPHGAYSKAIEAHRTSSTVRCRGDVVKEGKRYRLRNPRDFEIR